MTGERAEEGGGGRQMSGEYNGVYMYICVYVCLKITLDKVHARITSLISPILTPLLTWQVVHLSLSPPFKVHCGGCLRRVGLEGGDGGQLTSQEGLLRPKQVHQSGEVVRHLLVQVLEEGEVKYLI